MIIKYHAGLCNNQGAVEGHYFDTLLEAFNWLNSFELKDFSASLNMSFEEHFHEIAFKKIGDDTSAFINRCRLAMRKKST